MLYCTECGKKIVGKDNYCGNCGKEITKFEQEDSFSDVKIANNHIAETVKIIKKVPIVFCIMSIILIIVVALLVNPILNTPEETVKKFFQAIESNDLENAGEYMHPSVPWNTEVGEHNGYPKDASLEITNIEKEIVGESATLRVTLEIYPEPIYGNPEYIVVHLEKVEGKWLIYDMQ